MIGLSLALAKPMALVAACSKPVFIVFVPWYQYLELGPSGSNPCAILNFTVIDSQGSGSKPSSFLLIGMAIAQDLLRLAALIAVGYIIWGGIQYMNSVGAPDKTKQAQQTIINALIGLVLALMAAAIVTFLGNKLGGS